MCCSSLLLSPPRGVISAFASAVSARARRVESRKRGEKERKEREKRERERRERRERKRRAREGDAREEARRWGEEGRGSEDASPPSLSLCERLSHCPSLARHCHPTRAHTAAAACTSTRAHVSTLRVACSDFLPLAPFRLHCHCHCHCLPSACRLNFPFLSFPFLSS